MKNDRLLRGILTALFAAMVCVATLAIHIPIPATQGYVNLGDGILLLAAWFLGPVWGTAAGAIGSGLADLFLGYAVYIPGTVLAKGLSALIAALIFRALRDKIKGTAWIAGAAAELAMVAGYFAYEAAALGFGLAAAGSVPANLAQGAMGVIAGALLWHALQRVPAVAQYTKTQKRDKECMKK